MIQIHDLNFRVKDRFLLKTIDIEIKKGELIAIVGPNGAGKSTFLSCLGSEIPYQAKQFSLKNKDVNSYKKDEIPLHRSKFSQHQSAEINLKIDEIVLMGRYPYFKNDADISDKAITQNWMRKTETQHLIDREYEQHSGGEKQRLHLARVFTQLENNVENKLLLLDEPLNNLDVAHQFKTLHLIKEFTNKNNTALVVLHDLNIASQFADRLILLNKGMIELFDEPTKVLTQERISRVYQYPCILHQHPVTNQPIILFG